MAKRAHPLKTILLTCLFAAWPLTASSGAPSATAAAEERIAVSRTPPADANDPLWRWFREQDKLLDDILSRLARIEGLVGDIHRLVSSMPDRAATSAATPAAPAPAPIAQPPAKPRPARPPLPDFDDEDEGSGDGLAQWSMPLAGTTLLILLLLWRKKRSTAAAGSAPKVAPKPVKAPAAAPAAVPPAPTSATVAPSARATTTHVEAAPADNIEPVSEQVDQALELAEIMLSMGLGHGAAQTLAEQIRNEPKQALRHWLRLLEIYRKNGQQEEFERSAEELRQHFNVKPEDWQTQPDTPRSLEDYPHIANRLTELWGRPACLVYLHNLLADNRGGSRSGFPQSVAEELLLLAAMLRDDGIVS